MATGIYIGLVDGKVTVSPFKHMLDVVDLEHRRPLEQRGLNLRSVMQAMAQPAMTGEGPASFRADPDSRSLAPALTAGPP